jgi:hypothetical protein
MKRTIPLYIEVTVECGERTCVEGPGKRCRYYGFKRFGTVPVCMLFDRELFEENEKAQRCDECIEIFGVSGE